MKNKYTYIAISEGSYMNIESKEEIRNIMDTDTDNIRRYYILKNGAIIAELVNIRSLSDYI